MSFTASLDEIVETNSNSLLSKHASWERVRLGEVAQVLNGFAFPSSLFSSSEGLPLMRIRDVSDSKTEAYYSGEYDAIYLVKPGELVVGMDGDFNSSIWRGPTALLNQRVCKVSPRPDVYLLRFLAFVLPGYLSAINADTSSVTVKHLSSRTVNDIPLPLPPVAEQARISDKLDTLLTDLESAVTALRRAQANLKRYRASVLKAACEGRLVPTEAELARKQRRTNKTGEELLVRILKERRAKWESDQLARMIATGKPPKNDDWKKKYKEPAPPDTANLPPLPEGWTWASLEQVFAVERGRFSIRPRNDPRYYNGAYPFVQIGDLPRDGGPITGYSQTLNDRGLAVSRLFRRGTVLVAIVGATIGNSGVLQFDSCCPDSLVALQSDNESILRFGELYLQSRKHELRTASYASGGQPNINLAFLCPYPIPVPPESEAARIVSELDCRFSAIDNVAAQSATAVARASRLCQSILKRAFEGKLVPQDPKDEPASALLDRIRVGRGIGTSAESKSRGRIQKAKGVHA